jgi:hypothetical protein
MKSFGITSTTFLLCLASGAALAQEKPEKPNTMLIQPAPDQAPKALKPVRPGEAIKTADELLSALETADENLRSLDADILYERVFGLEGDRQVRQGKLYYVDNKQRLENGRPASGARKFAIHFKTLKLGNQPAMNQDQVLIFDGEWLVEKQPADKQIVKRQITRAGQGFDPLKVGEGPFPLPVGQRRADILQKFDATLLPPTQGLVANDPAMQKALEGFVNDTYQLKLVPKNNDPNAELAEIRLWYRQDSSIGRLLPRLARTVTPQGDVSLVQLVNVKVNTTVPDDVLDVATPPGWKEDVQALPAPPAPTPPAASTPPRQETPENRR